MEVETYEVTETNPETGLSEFAPEALALIEELGLEGQQELTSTRGVEGGEAVTTILPYRQMDATEERVYGYLLKKKFAVNSYNRGPIPLRVLQVAALAIREAWFETIEVWCPETVTDKDPLLVGTRDGNRYPLARWGEVLAPFEELAAIARNRWIEEKRAKLTRSLATVEEEATRYFGGDFSELSYV